MLIRSILNRDQKRRPTVSELLAHEYVARYVMRVCTDLGMAVVIVIHEDLSSCRHDPPRERALAMNLSLFLCIVNASEPLMLYTQ